jgi:hypothetical protein
VLLGPPPITADHCLDLHSDIIFCSKPRSDVHDYAIEAALKIIDAVCDVHKAETEAATLDSAIKRSKGRLKLVMPKLSKLLPTKKSGVCLGLELAPLTGNLVACEATFNPSSDACKVFVQQLAATLVHHFCTLGPVDFCQTAITEAEAAADLTKLRTEFAANWVACVVLPEDKAEDSCKALPDLADKILDLEVKSGLAE